MLRSQLIAAWSPLPGQIIGRNIRNCRYAVLASVVCSIGANGRIQSCVVLAGSAYVAVPPFTGVPPVGAVLPPTPPPLQAAMSAAAANPAAAALIPRVVQRSLVIP